MRVRHVRLLPEIDQRLARYARLRNETPERVAASAIEQMLRESADLELRIADARATADRYCG